MTVQIFSQATSMIAYLAGFCVFTLIYRITRDAAYLCLSGGYILDISVGVFYFVFFQMLGGDFLSGSAGFLFAYLTPLIRLAANLLMIIGFVKLGLRAAKNFQRPKLPPESGAET